MTKTKNITRKCIVMVAFLLASATTLGMTITEKQKQLNADLSQIIRSYSFTPSEKIEAIKNLLKQGARPDETDVENATEAFRFMQEPQPEIVKLLLQYGAPVPKKLLLFYRPSELNGPEITKYLTLFAPKELLINEYLNFPTEAHDFIAWLKIGSPTDKLQRGTLLKFTAIAFIMPQLTEEFKALLALLKPADFSKVFTQKTIQDALMTRNVKGFELLLPFIAKNKDLVNILRDELKDIDDQIFVEKIRTVIKNETGKPSTGKGDMMFHFSGKRKFSE